MIEATPEETIAGVRALRKAGSKEMEFSDSERERSAMKRKMNASREIENRRIDQE